MTFAEFAQANQERCEASFHRKVEPGTATAMALGVGEEAGEVLGALRAHLGISGRKTATVEDVGDEISDLVTYADLLASCLGLRLEDVLIKKFNRVSGRVGSEIRLLATPIPPVPAGAPGLAELLGELRDLGWSVAVHNDYALHGAHFTFWLFTHPDGRWIKGEGPDDVEALRQCRVEARPVPGAARTGDQESGEAGKP